MRGEGENRKRKREEMREQKDRGEEKRESVFFLSCVCLRDSDQSALMMVK